MISRNVIRRAVIGLAVLVASQLVWEHTAVSNCYHRAIAACAQRAYGRALSGGAAPRVAVAGEEFLVSVGGAKRETLHVGALDITGNLCVLLALIVASPVKPRLSVYLRAALAALILLFVLHVGGLYVIVKTALAWHAGLTDTHSESLIAALGPWMYPMVVLLWAPYLLGTRRPLRSQYYVNCHR